MHAQSRVLAAFVVLSYATPVYAQAPDTVRALDAEGTVVLPAIEVVASILPVAGPSIGSGIPARATSLSGRAIEDWEPRLLPEALASQAGISFYDDLGSPFKTTLAMRGFTAGPVVGLPQGVSVFLDGVPLNEPDARQVNFDLLPLGHVRRVEVLSGTASLLGPNSLGGAVNLVTRHGEGGPAAEVEASVGSFGAYSLDGSVGAEVRGWSYYLGSGFHREDGWRELTSAALGNAFVNVGRHGPERGLNLQAFAAQSTAETAGSLPLSVYAVRPRANLTAGDFEALRQLHLALSGYGRIGYGQGSFGVYARAHDAERYNVNQETDPDVRSFSVNGTVGGGADWSWTRAWQGGTLGIRVGADGAGSRTDVKIFAERLDPGLTTHVRSPISELGVFGIADVVRGRIALSGGARMDAIRIPFRNLLDPNRDTASVYLELNPRAGVSVQVGGGASLYASAGRSFRAPAVIELACADPENPCPLPFALGDDPPLDPVTAVTYEAGARWRRRGASLIASAYRTDVRDDIFLFPYSEEDEPQGSTIDGFFANVEGTRRQGVELEGRLLYGRAHSAYLSYAYTRATFELEGVELFSIREAAGGENEVERGDRLPLVPAHTLRAGADWGLTRGVELGAVGRYTGGSFLRGDEANQEELLEGYVLADVRAGFSKGFWSLRAIVRNVLDRRYAAFGTFNLHQAAGNELERFLTPGPPRSLQLVLERRFGR